jgi:hypothetical protein
MYMVIARAGKEVSNRLGVSIASKKRRKTAGFGSEETPRRSLAGLSPSCGNLTAVLFPGIEPVVQTSGREPP